VRTHDAPAIVAVSICRLVMSLCFGMMGFRG
jgi:hypothetical protein